MKERQNGEHLSLDLADDECDFNGMGNQTRQD